MVAKMGRVLKNPVEAPKEFDDHPTTLSASPQSPSFDLQVFATPECGRASSLDLDGPNRESPIASVQRTRSTWNEIQCCTNERQSRDSKRGAANAGSMRTYLDYVLEGDMAANER